MATTNRIRYAFLDAAVILAVARVVFLHGLNNFQIETMGGSLPFHSSPPWQQFLSILLRFSVPVFVVVSGVKYALSHSRYPERSYLSTLKKRSIRLLRPYLFWTVIIYFAVLAVAPGCRYVHSAYKGFPHISLSTLWNILNGSIHPAYPLWFIPMLFLLFVVYPPVYRYVPAWISQPLLWSLFLAIRLNHIPIPLSYPAYLSFFDLGARAGTHLPGLSLKRQHFLMALVGTCTVFSGIAAIRMTGFIGIMDSWLLLVQELAAPFVVISLAGVFFWNTSSGVLNRVTEYVWPLFLLHEPLILGQIGIVFYVRLGIQSAWVLPLTVVLSICATISLYEFLRRIRLHQILF